MSVGKLLGKVAKFALHKIVVPILKETAIDESAKAVAKRRERRERS